MTAIPESNPFINVSNWPTYEAQGWRWARNTHEPKRMNKYGTLAIIASYQIDFGISRVTVGNAWNEAWFGPVGEVNKIGIYVQDTKNQVEALYRDLEKIELGEL